jgi:hypothetical protein
MAITEEQLQQIMYQLGENIVAKAKQLVPVDLGELRDSIYYEVRGHTLIIGATSNHARDMEYGKPAEPLSNNEVEDITMWAMRKGFSPAGAAGVVAKIESRGIKVGSVNNPHINPDGTSRPFMRPAIYENIFFLPELIQGIIE